MPLQSQEKQLNKQICFQKIQQYYLISQGQQVW